jgi:hypothetical protein
LEILTPITTYFVFRSYRNFFWHERTKSAKLIPNIRKKGQSTLVFESLSLNKILERFAF